MITLNLNIFVEGCQDEVLCFALLPRESSRKRRPLPRMAPLARVTVRFRKDKPQSFNKLVIAIAIILPPVMKGSHFTH